MGQFDNSTMKISEIFGHINKIFERTSCGKGPLRPSALYNEGWMLNLLIEWATLEAPEIHPFHFLDGAEWYAEPQLPTPFAPRYRKDKLGEGRTNADSVIGHFSVGQTGKGDFSLCPLANQFVVIEAKMFSPLSSGTTHAEGYDQAARTVACMAEALYLKKRDPNLVQKLAFLVVAPEEQIAKGIFGDKVTEESIRKKVRKRSKEYAGDKKDAWYEQWFEPTLAQADIRLLCWEKLLPEGSEYVEFYQECLRYSR